MFTAKTLIDFIEVSPQTGHVSVRIMKQLHNNGVVVASEYHRTTIEPDGDSAAMMDEVNAHLAAMGYPAVDPGERATLDGLVAHAAPIRTAKAAEKAVDKAAKKIK